MSLNDTAIQLILKIIHGTHVNLFRHAANSANKMMMMPDLTLTTMKTKFHFPVQVCFF